MKRIKIFPAYIAICFLMVISVNTAHAQDTIIKKNGDIIKAKITEIGTDEVKFKIFGESDGPTIVLKRTEIKTAKVGGQTIISEAKTSADTSEDVIVKKNGDLLKVKVTDIGTDEVKFKLFNSPDGPTISIKKSEIKTMKVDGQMIIEIKKTGADEDVIYKKDGTSLKVKIAEIGTDEVKYKIYNNPDGPTLSIKKSEVQTIKIEGQVVYEYKEDPRSMSNNAILDKTSCLKFYFFSPLNHHIAVGYEWMNKPGFNWDASIGIIGPGTGINLSARDRKMKGAFLRFGPKFLLGNSSDIEIEGAKYAHPLKGRYFKIEIILNTLSVTNRMDTTYYYYNPNSSYYNYSYTNKYQSMTLDLGYGRQFIFGNSITVGFYFGLGYSFESKTSDRVGTVLWYNDYQANRYSHSYYGKNFPLATTLRFTIGYITRTPDWLSSKSSKMPNKPPTRHSMTE